MSSWYKKISVIVVILVVLVSILVYMKMVLLYYPIPANHDKYEKFYQKLGQLVEIDSFILNTMVRTPDRILLHTIYIENPDTDKCIIIFHGNAGNIAMRFDMIKFLYNYSSVVVFDYRSYGKSNGSNTGLSCDNLMTDAQTIWNFVIADLDYNPHNVSLFGESLGCSIAIGLASNLSKTLDPVNYPHSLILNAPFYSLSSMIEMIFSKINLGFLGKFLSIFIGSEYRSNEWIQYINHQTKILIAHSLRDEVIPYIEGQKLYKCIAQSHGCTEFVNITGTHNNLGLTDHYIYALAKLFN